MIQTHWGYDILSQSMPQMLSVEEYNEFTGGKFAGDVRIQPALSAAESAVRAYVGWHLARSADCCIVVNAGNLHLSNRMDTLIQLPTKFLSDVTKVLLNAKKVDGEWIGDEAEFEFERNGILTVYDCGRVDRRSKIYVEFESGLSDNAIADVKEIISHMASHGLSSSFGIQSESTGGVSVTYSATWAGTASSSALTDEIKNSLMPYRIQGVL